MLGLFTYAITQIILANALLVGTVAGALALAWFVPRLRDYALAAAALAVVAFLIFNDGVQKGEARIQAKWDAAEQAAIAQGKRAADDTEREIAPVAGDPPAPGYAVPIPQPANGGDVPAGGQPSTARQSGGVPECKPQSRYDRC